VELRSWLRADLGRREVPPGADERSFLLVAPVVVLLVAHATDPGPLWLLVVLLPAVLAFAARALLRAVPAEVFAVLVVVPVTVAVGRDGDLEGAFFLSVTMVLYAAWSLGSVVRAVAITVVAAVAPWFVAVHLVPGSGIGWHAWTVAHVLLFVLGRTLHRQRQLIEQLASARQALADQAVAEERRRIARELHDVAGHTIAAVVLHVTGARHVLRRDPVEAEAALVEAEAVGRAGLDQVRAVVAALRTDERGTDPALPGVAELPALVEEYLRAGLAVRASIDDRVAGLDGPVGTAVHRIAREALANAARHAPTNEVELALRPTGDGTVRLEVADRGRAGAPVGDGAHFGLVGMAERARALGGQVEAGPTPDGWRVVAELPVAGRRRAGSPA
jgi:signal transduction histidine kinase